MKKTVSLLCFIFFLNFSNFLLAEVDFVLKQNYPKCTQITAMNVLMMLSNITLDTWVILVTR